LHNAGLLAQASKIGSKLYARLPHKHKRRSDFQYLTGLAFQEIAEADIIRELLPTLPKDQPDKPKQPTLKKNTAGLIVHPKGHYVFIPSHNQRIVTAAIGALPVVDYRRLVKFVEQCEYDSC
jgi:hypothetical protein